MLTVWLVRAITRRPGIAVVRIVAPRLRKLDLSPLRRAALTELDVDALALEVAACFGLTWSLMDHRSHRFRLQFGLVMKYFRFINRVM